MATKNSPAKFKEYLQEGFLVLLWRQWRTLGITAYSPETKQLIDLEALILATSIAAEQDQRLWTAVIRWLACFQDWVNQARLKRMSAAFIKPDEYLKKPLIKKEIWQEVELLLSTTLSSKKTTTNTSRAKRTLTPPLLKKPPLLQLYLRGIFGVNARAELILFLLVNGEGNSNQIARETFYDQKNIYVILERWAESGFVTKESRGKQNQYSLDSGDVFLQSNISSSSFWSWPPFFQLYSRLLIAASSPPWSNDPYLLSSLFRDVYPQAMSISKKNRLLFPDPKLFPGDNYFPPMSQKLLDLLKSSL
ncbi:MAG TPA: winged helix-turn-helix domain-containing protein [Patescibacteria group bacterium]|nr:winged helix-turn-helix domain-containing protein [Patescibacteria group bacterium]